MDPLSIAAGVGGLIALSIQLVEIGTKYNTRSPKAQGLDFIFELRPLIEVLKRLKEFLEGPNAPQTFDRVSALLSTSSRCDSKLQEVLRKLQKATQEPNKIKRGVDRILWPVVEKELREAIEDIHRYTDIFEFALTVDGCALLAKSSSETASALKEQAQKIEETKKLCGSIPNLVAQMETFSDQIMKILSIVQDLPHHTKELASVSQGISDLKFSAKLQESRYDEAERKKMLSWLSPMTFEARQRQLFEIHQPGTGEWLLQHERFLNWRATKGSSLWCSGIPGAGKTIMASIVINALRNDKETAATPVGFIYADYKDHRHQSLDNLLSAITRQLAMQEPQILEIALSKYQDRVSESQDDEVPRLTVAEHLEILHEASKYVDRYFVVVDAVDEILGTDEIGDTDVRSELLNHLAQLGYLSVFCTSRPHIDGSVHFHAFSELTIEANAGDLRKFLKETISTSRRLKSFISIEKGLEKEIVETITKKASGMFLMARLQVEEVKTALSVRQVRVVLGKLSGKLADMYKTTLKRITDQPEAEAELALRAITWTAYVKRPLTMSEFVHAMSLEADDTSLDGSSLIDMNIILETCGGLLQLQPASQDLEIGNGPFISDQTVGFVHYTLQEYMDSSANQTEAHCDIANASLAYLCLQTFQEKGPGGHPNARQEYPFLAYAAPFWPAHAEKAGNELLKGFIEMLISPSIPNLSKNWLRFALREQFGPLSTNIPSEFAGTVAAIQDAPSVLQLILDSGNSVNVRYLERVNPFGLALSSGPRSCLRQLFASGLSDYATPNQHWVQDVLQDCHDSDATNLFISLLEEHIDVIHGSDHPDIEFHLDGFPPQLYHGSLLARSVLLNEVDIVKRLLKAGWNLHGSFAPWFGETPKGSTLLHLAICQSSLEMVQLLIQEGSNVAGPWPGRSPLRQAIERADEAIIKVLLDAGAPVDDMALDRDTPLIAAITLRKPKILKMLLESSSGKIDFWVTDHPDAMDEALKDDGLEIKDEENLIGILAPYYFPSDLSVPYFAQRIYRIFNRGRFALIERLLQARHTTTNDAWLQDMRRLITDASHLKDNTVADCHTIFHETQLPRNLLDLLQECNREFIKEERSRTAIFGKCGVLELVIRCGNLPLLQLIMETDLGRSSHVVHERMLVTAIAFNQLPIINHLLGHGLRVRGHIERLALECYLLIEGYCPFAWSLVEKVPMVAYVPDRTYDWLSYEKLFYMCRKADDAESDLFEKAMQKGIGIYDTFRWWTCILRWKEEFEACDSEGVLPTLVAEALEDSSFDCTARLAELDTGDGHSAFLSSSSPNVPDTLEVRQVESFLRQVRAPDTVYTHDADDYQKMMRSILKRIVLWKDQIRGGASLDHILDSDQCKAAHVDVEV